MRKKMDEDMKAIGAHIKKARMKAELIQEVLAERIDVTIPYLSDLERGLVGTSLSTLMKICRCLNISADYILFGEGHRRFRYVCDTRLFEKAS